LNRALRALSKDRSTAHVADSLARLSSAEPSDLVAEAATALSPSGRGVKSLSIQRGVPSQWRCAHDQDDCAAVMFLDGKRQSFLDNKGEIL
jgi:hypothetical protein